MPDLNILAVIVAALSSFLLGGIWYGPFLFCKAWIRENGGERPENVGKAGHPARVFGVGFVLAFVAAYLFAWLIGPNPSLDYAVCRGSVVGVGFVAASFGINYGFASRSLKLWLIDGGYHAVQFTLYGLVLGLWH